MVNFQETWYYRLNFPHRYRSFLMYYIYVYIFRWVKNVFWEHFTSDLWTNGFIELHFLLYHVWILFLVHGLKHFARSIVYITQIWMYKLPSWCLAVHKWKDIIIQISLATRASSLTQNIGWPTSSNPHSYVCLYTVHGIAKHELSVLSDQWKPVLLIQQRFSGLCGFLKLLSYGFDVNKLLSGHYYIRDLTMCHHLQNTILFFFSQSSEIVYFFHDKVIDIDKEEITLNIYRTYPNSSCNESFINWENVWIYFS